MSVRAISWAAVSSRPQMEGESIADQLEQNRRLVDSFDGEVIAELIVPGQSREYASLDEARCEIEAYDQLIHLVHERRANLLVFKDARRLGRKKSLIELIAEECLSHGVSLYSRETPPSTIDPRLQRHDLMLSLMISITGWQSQGEMSYLRRQNAIGMARRIEDGMFDKLPPPYGWRVTYDTEKNATIHVDENAKRAIRYILLDLYLDQSLSVNAVTQRLREEGKQVWGGKRWTKSAVLHTIRMIDTYAGWLEYGGAGAEQLGIARVRARGAFEPLITEEERRALQSYRESRSFRRRGFGEHRFSGILICNRCQNVLSFTSFRPSSNPRTRIHSGRYRCENSCPGSTFMEHWAVSALAYTIQCARSPQARQQILAQRPRQQEHLLNQIEALSAEDSRLADALDRAERAMVDGFMDYRRYQSLVREKRDQRQRLQRERDVLLSQVKPQIPDAQVDEMVDDVIAIGMEMLTTKDEALANQWFRRMFRVYVENNRVNRVEYAIWLNVA